MPGHRQDAVEGRREEFVRGSVIAGCGHHDYIVGDGVRHRIGKRLGMAATEGQVDDVGALVNRPGDAGCGG